MKCIIIIILFINVIKSCGKQTKEDSLNYFPHKVGNLWQYVYDNGIIETTKIIRDSIDTNGNVFLNYGSTPIPIAFWLYRVNKSYDSIFYSPNSLNWLKYKFPIDNGDKWEVSNH